MTDDQPTDAIHERFRNARRQLQILQSEHGSQRGIVTETLDFLREREIMLTGTVEPVELPDIEELRKEVEEA